MSLHEPCFFVLVVIVAFGTAGRLDRHVIDRHFFDPHITDRHIVDRHQSVGSHEEKTFGAHGDKTFGAESELLPAVFLPVQTRNTKGLGAGKMLVASRDLGDPHFIQTVILLVRYDAEGVVGLILNRRTDVPLSRVLGDLKGAKDRSDPVYVGGPVETPAVFALLQSPAKIEGAEHVFGGVYLISAKTLFEQTISKRPDQGVFHVYLGYAGWTIAQLRQEVELGAWFFFPGDASTVFSTDPDALWPQMIRKTELKLAGNEPAGSSPWPDSSAVVQSKRLREPRVLFSLLTP